MKINAIAVCTEAMSPATHIRAADIRGMIQIYLRFSMRAMPKMRRS